MIRAADGSNPNKPIREVVEALKGGQPLPVEQALPSQPPDSFARASTTPIGNAIAKLAGKFLSTDAKNLLERLTNREPT